MEDIELLQEQESRLEEVARPFAEYVVEEINRYAESNATGLWEQMYLKLRIISLVLSRNTN